jgi:hypothetical protein
MYLMVEAMDTNEKRQDLIYALTGPFRTMGSSFNPEDANAPDWWHGDDEAFNATMAAVGRIPQRGR